MVTLADQDLVRPRLAEDVPSLENGLWRLSPDGGMETTWRIREGAAWHDGVPFTSEDLLFTLRVGREGALPVFNHSSYAMMGEVEATDARTVRIRWTRPYINADRMFTRAFALPLPQHLLEKAFVDNLSTFADLPYWTQDFVGTGPFRLREFVVDSHISLVANDRYLYGKPKVDGIDIRFVPDANSLMAHMLAGAGDLTLGTRLSLDQALQVRDQWSAGQVVFSATSWTNIYPQFINPTPPVVLDLRFRRALAHSVDRQQIQDTLFRGVTSVVDGVVGPYQPEYADIQDAVVRYAYDPNRATQILDEMGYQKGPDGQYRDPSGQRLTFELRSTAQLEHDAKAVAATADDWRRLGLDVQQLLVPIQLVPDREYRHTRPAFEIVSGGAGPEAIENFRSTRAPVPGNNFSGTNRSRYQSVEYDALLDTYFSTIPHAERMEALRQIVRHHSDQLVFIGLSYTPSHLLVGNRVKNVTGRGFGSVTGWNVGDWDVN
jgi:peptide/nickel transport system substrate-binding protein